MAELETQQRSPLSSEPQQPEAAAVSSPKGPQDLGLGATSRSIAGRELAQRPCATPRESQADQDATPTPTPTPTPATQLTSSTELPADDAEPAVENPLVPERAAYHSDGAGRLRYMGHSSTWSFSRQVIQLVYSRLHASSSPTTFSGLDGDTYHVSPPESPSVTDPWSFAGLPSLDLSLFYLQTVKFRTYPLFHLYDEAEFTHRLRGFYQAPRAYAQANRIWYAHYLVLMAFGKTLASPNIPERGPAGADMFARALQVLPDMTQLCCDSVEATEVFCCVALYLQSIDHRSAAYVYVRLGIGRLGVMADMDRSDKLCGWRITMASTIFPSQTTLTLII